MSTTATTETPVTFSREIANLLHAAGGNPVSACMQCGTCSGTCPVGEFMDVRPQRLIRMIDAGLKDKVLATRSFWYCASCYQCSVRCPRDIDIAGLMYGLKRYTIWKRQHQEDLIGPTFSETFVKNIVRTGRSYEPVLATSYFFTLGLKEMMQEAAGATMLMLKGRLPVLPARIKRLENFKRMIKRIIPIGD